VRVFSSVAFDCLDERGGRLKPKKVGPLDDDLGHTGFQQGVAPGVIVVTHAKTVIHHHQKLLPVFRLITQAAVDREVIALIVVLK